MRISDIGLQQILLTSFQRAQGAAEQRQIQLSTGKVSNVYSGIGSGVAELLSSKGVIARAGAYNDAAAVADAQLKTQEAGLSTIEESIARLQQTFTATISSGSAELIAPAIAAEAQRILAALNIETGGIYVFGGVNGDVPPVNAQSIGDLQAATNTGTLFVDAARKQLAVEEGISVDGGPLARDVAEGLLQSLKELADAPATLGSFQGSLTTAQSQFLSQKIAEFDGYQDNVLSLLGLNGVAQKQTADAQVRNGQRSDLAEVVASDLESVDLAEVVSRLNQDQLTIQAAAQALSQSRQLSLLNYL